MLTAEQSVLLALVRASLWGEVPPENPEIAMDEARKQAMVPLGFPESPEAMAYSARYIRILYAQDEIVELMRSAGIPMVILKGSAAAVYYPEPFLRTMGDIDFIVPQDRFQEASDLMSQNGFQLERDLDDTDRHRGYKKDGIEFELHHHYSFEGIDIEKYVIDGLKQPDTITIGGHTAPILPPLVNGMVLLAHVASHLRSGLGLRQVIDWMMYVDKILGDEMWNGEFRAAAASCGLETLALTMTKTCRMFLGLPDRITWCDAADEQLAADLMVSLLVTGNFGHELGKGSQVEMVSTSIKRNGLFRYLQIAGEHNWKAYQRNHWLKPFCWFYQIFRYARQGIQSGRNKARITDDLARSRSRYNLLTRLGID